MFESGEIYTVHYSFVVRVIYLSLSFFVSAYLGGFDGNFVWNRIGAGKLICGDVELLFWYMCLCVVVD